MASQSETGHAVNLAQAQGLYDFCQGLGAAFKPAAARLKLPAFAQQLIEAKDAIERAAAAERAEVTAGGRRSAAFQDLMPLVTRAIRSFRTSGAAGRTVASAETLCRRLQGSRAGEPTVAADGTAAPTRSVSQKSYTMQAANFGRFVGILSETREYAPEEEDLTAAALRTRHLELDAANAGYAAPAAALSEAQLRRDQLLYAEKTGLVDTALAIKEYVGSIDKRKHPGAAAVQTFRFRNYRSLLKKAGIA